METSSTSEAVDAGVINLECLGGRVSLPLAIAKKSTTLTNLMEDASSIPDGFPLPVITSKTMDHVVSFYRTHDGEPSDQSYLHSLTTDDLFRLILAANFLDMKELLDAACFRVSVIIKGNSTEEIRKILSIKNDFTPEEEAQVIAETEWCTDGTSYISS